MTERMGPQRPPQPRDAAAPVRGRTRPRVQRRLTVGAANDPLEREADRAADQVMHVLRSTAGSGGTAAFGTADSSRIHRHADHEHHDHRCGPACGVPSEIDMSAGAAHATRIRRHAGHGHGGHQCGPGCGVPPEIVRAAASIGAARIRRHAGHDHHGHEGGGGPEVGLAGGAISAELSGRIRSAAGGVPLPSRTQARMEQGFGASFAAVRVHPDSELPRQIAADAFTAGTHVHFAPGRYDPSSSSGERLLAHELAHVVQQGGATVSRHPEEIHRHSSFEHLMLGNVKPEDLAKVGAWQDAIEQTKPSRTGVSKKLRGSGGGQAVAQVDVNLGSTTLSISKANILHVLLQEMIRLRKWQKDPPGESSVEQAHREGGPIRDVGKDQDFQVVTVRLPQGILCTYGEMNTLADYYGSVKVLEGADRKHVRQLLQSVRDETWGFLSETFQKVAASLTDAEERDPAMQGIRETFINELAIPEVVGDGTSFSDSTAFRISGLFGQLELLGGIQGTGAKGKTNKYGTSLGRNACHFVPESWHAWASNHNEARKLAADAHAARQRAQKWQTWLGTGTYDQQTTESLNDKIEQERALAVELAEKALVANGFGDHFLQDSYASGHMINKTQIMQFYIEFIDANNLWDYFKDANWRKVQNIAYTQNLAPPSQYALALVEGYSGMRGGTSKGIDPQSVENRSNGTWQQNFKELGLRVPAWVSDPTSAPRQVLDVMQAKARAGKDELKGTDIIKLLEARGVTNVATRMAVADMLLDGVLLADVDVSKRGRQMASMRDKRAAVKPGAGVTEGAGEAFDVQEFRKGKFRLRPELKPKKGSTATVKSEADIHEDFKAITYLDYLEFIQSSFLQKSTNALHDTFCKGGLTVYDRRRTEIGRVYGDDAMFNKESSMGVAHSGETSQMSRDAILSIINSGNDGGRTVQSIVDRFPYSVRADVYDHKGKLVAEGSGPMPIQKWHNSKDAGGLQYEANQWIFKKMNWKPVQKIVPGAFRDLGTFFTAPPPHAPF